MGFTYSKSVYLWLFRVNLSEPGLGFSVGGRGLRVGTTPQGRKYCLARAQRVSPVGLLFKQATELPPSRLVPGSVSPGRALAIAHLALVVSSSWQAYPPLSPSAADPFHSAGREHS